MSRIKLVLVTLFVAGLSIGIAACGDDSDDSSSDSSGGGRLARSDDRRSHPAYR